MNKTITNRNSKIAKHWDKYIYFWDKIMSKYPDYHKLKNWHIHALLNKKIILDFGAGTGSITYELLKNGLRVYAVDISKDALKILRGKCREHSKNLVIKKLNVSNISWVQDKFFDGINSMIVLPYIDDAISHLRDLYRVLKRNGVLVLSTNDPNYKGNLKDFYKALGNIKGVGQEDLKRFLKLVKHNIHVKAKTWFTPGQLKKILLDIGFKKVSRPKYVDYKISYFVKAQK